MSKQEPTASDCPPTRIDDSIMAKFEDVIPEYFPRRSQPHLVNGDGHDSSLDSADKIIEFLCLIGRLKTLPRRGWSIRCPKMVNPEPIAGHMYRMAIMSLLFDDDKQEVNVDEASQKKCSPKVDFLKMMQLSLVHDMAECIVGDVTPHDNINVDQKHKEELDAIKKLAALLPKQAGDRLLSLYLEYDERKSNESLLVKELDSFDLCLQSYQYERQEYFNFNRVSRFDKFFQVADERIHHPMLRKMTERLLEERKHWWHEQIEKHPELKDKLSKCKDIQLDPGEVLPKI